MILRSAVRRLARKCSRTHCKLIADLLQRARHSVRQYSLLNTNCALCTVTNTVMAAAAAIIYYNKSCST